MGSNQLGVVAEEFGVGVGVGTLRSVPDALSKLFAVLGGDACGDGLVDVVEDAMTQLEPGALTLDVIGDGPMRPALTRRVERRGLAEVVRLRGRLPRDQVRAAYRDADVFLAPATLEAFASWLEGERDRAERVQPHPGRPRLRRLNRVEYGNAVRDLLSLSIDPASLVPPDNAAFGFDNISDVLGLSPTLQERYLAAADREIVVLTGDRILAIASPARDKPFAADELNALVRGSCRLHRGADDGDRAS